MVGVFCNTTEDFERWCKEFGKANVSYHKITTASDVLHATFEYTIKSDQLAELTEEMNYIAEVRSLGPCYTTEEYSKMHITPSDILLKLEEYSKAYVITPDTIAKISNVLSTGNSTYTPLTRHYDEQTINELIANQLKASNGTFNEQLISDGYHTFKELYKFRLAYNALAFNALAIMRPVFCIHKSWRHNDGEYCFGTPHKYFIVCAELPTGQISNHYEAEYWDLFSIPSYEKAKFKWDGHQSEDAINRLMTLLNSEY